MAADDTGVQPQHRAGDPSHSPHMPIMLSEVLRHLRPRTGGVIVDATLGGGGHAQAVLERLGPGGQLIGFDVDPLELPRTEARLRALGHGPERFVACRANFADIGAVLAQRRIAPVDGILADLGVSTMQHDTPARGFSYKTPGPLDLRMDPTRGEPAWARVAGLPVDIITAMLEAHADEPHAATIAPLLASGELRTTHVLERQVRARLAEADPTLSRAAIKLSVRRTFQALRILVNDEFTALDALLRDAPWCLRPGGRLVMLTFHSGEDRRVKRAFAAGRRDGTWRAVAPTVVRSAKAETFANRRAASAKLRWAVRA